MIVDDSPTDRFVIKRIVERGGLAKTTLEFPSGFEALEYLKDGERFAQETGPFPPPVLILLDINMPRVNGFEFLAELHALIESQQIPSDSVSVAMLTSSGDSTDLERAGEFSEVLDYLVKPLNLERAVRVAEKAAASCGAS